MKLLVFSDIHGSSEAGVKIKEAIQKHNPDKIIILGDILHGAYDGDTSLISLLRHYSNIITAVRGNCDYPSDADDLLFSLPEYAGLVFEGHSLHLSHHPQFAISFPPGDIVMFGHTHIKELRKEKGVLYLNPGSCAFPRDEGTSYAFLSEGTAYLFDLTSQKELRHLDY